jgi:hypothetical protein
MIAKMAGYAFGSNPPELLQCPKGPEHLLRNLFCGSIRQKVVRWHLVKLTVT